LRLGDGRLGLRITSGAVDREEARDRALVDGVAALLYRLQHGRGDLAAILVDRLLAFLDAAVGVLRGGAPLDVDQGIDRVLVALVHAGVEIGRGEIAGCSLRALAREPEARGRVVRETQGREGRPALLVQAVVQLRGERGDRSGEISGRAVTRRLHVLLV